MMRIDYQGHVEVQPPYQHVGYLAAAMMGDSRVSGGGFPPLFTGSVLMLAVAGAMAARRLRTGWRWAALIVSAAAVTGVCVAGARIASRVHVAPEFYTTMYRLEALDANTEAWITKHGRVPSQQEWRQLTAGESALDGWGNRFRYSTLSEEVHFFGVIDPRIMEYAVARGYVVWSERDREGDGPHIGDLTNWHFGADGLFGTGDDERNFASGLKLTRGKHLDPRKYPHARGAREVTPDAH